MNIIVAVSENNVIGYHGSMPWHLRSDLQRFKQLTTGKTVIMGRKTYESIGHPLPQRRNIVVTRDALFRPSFEVMKALPAGTTLEVYHELAEAVEKSPAECFVMGGEKIYRQLWQEADVIYLTRIHTVIEQYDATVPPIPSDFCLVRSEEIPQDKNNEYASTFQVWKKKPVSVVANFRAERLECGLG